MSPVIIGKISDNLGSELKNASSLVIITDKNIEKLHLEAVLKLLPQKAIQVISLRPGELSKSRATKAKIETAMFEANCDRNTLMIAFGGGVVGDLTGFVAATYMRGIRYINIPTSFLAMVDSSIGGKVAINVPQGKNLIGAYWSPVKTIVDVEFLTTLPALQIINGAIEAFKMFLTCDAGAVSKFENEFFSKSDNFAWLIQNSIDIKSKIVQEDEREIELRKILNFGHTVGHAIENASAYQLLHGIAVGYGILVEAKISQLLGYLSSEHYKKITEILLKMDLNFSVLAKFDVNQLVSLMKQDKKNQAGKIYCVLLNGLGSVYQKNNKIVHPVDEKIIKQAMQAVLSGE